MGRNRAPRGGSINLSRAGLKDKGLFFFFASFATQYYAHRRHPRFISGPRRYPKGTSEERGDAHPTITAALPTRRRLVYLPPGAPGVVHADAGEAAWIGALRRAAWVPTAAGTLEVGTGGKDIKIGGGGGVGLGRLGVPTAV